jgi:hypothetical protein
LKLVPSGTTVCLEPTARGGGEVAVAYSPNGAQANVAASLPTDPHASVDWPQLSESAAELNGRLEPGPAPAWFTLVFRQLPLAAETIPGEDKVSDL